MVTGIADASPTFLSYIFTILSDNDSSRMLHIISKRRPLKISDFRTPKRYYERIAKLKKAHLITDKKKNRKHTAEDKTKTNYELTDLGLAVNDSLLTLRRAANVHWGLRAIDAVDGRMPCEERNKLIEKLIHDETIRKILLQKNT